MRVLLIHPPTSSKHAEPPLGVAYLAAYLREKGHDCALIDMYAHGLEVDDLPPLLEESSPQLVGVSFMTPQHGYAAKVFKAVKVTLPGAVTVAGGPHPTCLPTEVLAMEGVDLVVQGEGEETLAELAEVIEGGTSLETVKGLAWRKPDGTHVVNPRRPLVRDLDQLPVPAWDLLSRYSYVDRPLYKRKEVKVFPIITARGCPFRCIFCDEGNIWRHKVRFRSVSSVLDEVNWLYRSFGARTFNILDDTFTLRPKRVLEFCAGIRAHKLDIDWRCTAKSSTVTTEMLSAMAAAGCKLVGYGVESGNETILANIRKRQTLDGVRKAIRLTREAGMLSVALCMVGNLGETPETVQDTIRFIEETGPDFASCAIMTPYPGSEMYRICTERGWIVDYNWDRWVPTPHGIPHFRPVSIIEDMDQDSLLSAYYRFNAAILKNRFRRRYGRFYFLSPSFIRREVLHRIGVSGIGHFLKTVWRLFRAHGKL